MTFAFTLEKKLSAGNMKVHIGTFTNAGGDSGGDIVTGLIHVDYFKIQLTGSAVSSSVPVVNETLPGASGTVTIVTAAGDDGVWEAWGK